MIQVRAVHRAFPHERKSPKKPQVNMKLILFQEIGRRFQGWKIFEEGNRPEPPKEGNAPNL